MQHRGYITLISVLVLGAIGAAVAGSLLLLGLGTSRTGFAVEQSGQARGLADACAEEGLEQLAVSAGAFTGSGTLTLGAGTCAYTVQAAGGSKRTVTASGSVGTVIRRVEVWVSGASPVTVSTWEELGDFQ